MTDCNTQRLYVGTDFGCSLATLYHTHMHAPIIMMTDRTPCMCWCPWCRREWINDAGMLSEKVTTMMGTSELYLIAPPQQRRSKLPITLVYFRTFEMQRGLIAPSWPASRGPACSSGLVCINAQSYCFITITMCSDRAGKKHDDSAGGY